MSEMLTVLVVDDDDVDREIVRRALRSGDIPCEVVEASSGADALSLCQAHEYDVIMLDNQLGDIEAVQLIPSLRALSVDGEQALILITGVGNESLAVQALKLGALDYLPKAKLNSDTIWQSVKQAREECARRRQQAREQEQLRQQAFMDPLTGLPNRLLFHDHLDLALSRACRNGSGFAVLVLDLDRFKPVNDNHGHHIGDQVLQQIGRRLTGFLRGTDTVARVGGDEFWAILDTADADIAQAVARKMLAAVQEAIPHEGLTLQVRASAGIAMYPEHGETGKELLIRADSAMYQAKRTESGTALAGV